MLVLVLVPALARVVDGRVVVENCRVELVASHRARLVAEHVAPGLAALVVRLTLRLAAQVVAWPGELGATR